MQIKDIVKKLRTELKDEAAHDYHLRFQKRMMKIDQETLGEDELLMFTDFAAGIKHTPPKSECCSHEKQSVLDVYVVLMVQKLLRLSMIMISWKMFVMLNVTIGLGLLVQTRMAKRMIGSPIK
jgi:hypothetical protein